MVLKLPTINLIDFPGNSIGKDVTEIIRQSYSGGFSNNSKIIFRWGQNTSLNQDSDIVIFDCGYFLREYSDKQNRHFRLSINEYHPKNLPPADGDRWDKLGIQLEDLYNPSGHIILVGRGRKTRRQQGGLAPTWEKEAYKKLRTVYPDRKIIYRPKKMEEKIRGCKTDYQTPIRDLCKGAALIYTQRSNIGNEGIVYGIPVITEDGPASDICANNLFHEIYPLPFETRLDFLQRLAYWQWSLYEMKCGEPWPWIIQQVKIRTRLKN